jgi:hypothetical protein
MKVSTFKEETLDRMGSFASDMPKYQRDYEKLIINFTVDQVLSWLRVIDRDNEFKNSRYRNIYNIYFDEIEEMVFNLA